MYTKVPYTTAIEVYLLVNITFILAVMLEYIAVIQTPDLKFVRVRLFSFISIIYFLYRGIGSPLDPYLNSRGVRGFCTINFVMLGLKSSY